MSKFKNKNAISHGVYSAEVVLPWESQDDFDALLAQIRASFNPIGPLEEEKVFDLATLYHLKGRVRSAYHKAVAFNSLSERACKAMEEGPEAVQRLMCEEARSGGQTLTITSQELLARIKKKQADAEQPSGAIPTSKQMHDFLSRLHGLEEMDQMLKREATIDARIDKAISRLAILKECRLRYGTAPALQGPTT